MNTNKRPPLGIIPRKLFMEQRALLILNTLTRRIEDDYPMNNTTDEWIEELKDITKNYLDREIRIVNKKDERRTL